MYLRVPWWVMYLFSCLSSYLKQTSWLRLADASGLDFQCCFHHDLGPHQHCASFNDPIHEETTLSAGIHHHVTWRCVLDQGHHGLFVTRHVSKHRCFKLPKKNQVWHPNHWTQRPGYSLHALWCLLVSLWEWDGGEEWPFNQERRVAHQAMGNLVALSWKPESICSPCELLLILCSFFLGRCLWLPCFQKKHLQPFANNDYSVCLRCAIWTLAQPWILLPRFMLEVASKTSSSKPKSHSEIDHPF